MWYLIDRISIIQNNWHFRIAISKSKTQNLELYFHWDRNGWYITYIRHHRLSIKCLLPYFHWMLLSCVFLLLFVVQGRQSETKVHGFLKDKLISIPFIKLWFLLSYFVISSKIIYFLNKLFFLTRFTLPIDNLYQYIRHISSNICEKFILFHETEVQQQNKY